MQVQLAERNANSVYTGYQFGNDYRVYKNTKKNTYIQSKQTLGENSYRFNWQTPIHLSKHTQDMRYLGCYNKLFQWF